MSKSPDHFRSRLSANREDFDAIVSDMLGEMEETARRYEEMVGALRQCRDALRNANTFCNYKHAPRVPGILLAAATRADKALGVDDGD